MSRNNKNYGVNNLGDMGNGDDEEQWKRSDDIDAEYASNKKEAERRFIKKHFPNLKPSTENLNKILYAFDYLDVVCDDILHYLPLDENSMDTWKLLLNAYFDFKKHKEQGGYTDEWGE